MSTQASRPGETANDPHPPRKPRIYTIPPSQPFLLTLAKALLDGSLPTPGGKPRGPLELSGITLLLPTRRATRALQDAFLAAGSSRALLLPRIRPIAEGEEDLTLLSGLAGLSSISAAELEIPASVSELERRLVLTQLVMQWSAVMRRADHSDDDPPDGQPVLAAGADTPAQAANLARELARLVDMVETENVSLTGLEGIVDDEFSAHWQQTLTFLKIVTQWWPAHLAESGKLSPMDRRNQLIMAEARRLNETKPTSPMIVAGVTGSIPATVELMRAVASLDQGAIVLPGVDLDLDEASWQAITSGGSDGRPHSEHPQFGLKTLLDRLGVDRKEITLLSNIAPASGLAVREKLVSEAMRPSSTTAGWHTFAANANKPSYIEAVDGLTLIEAASAQDEAETVALIMREVAQTPGKTAALVSPDRLLARRVAIRLEAWGIRVDDSAGRPFAKTVPGTVLDLAIEAISTGFAPGPTIALLKHPLVRLQLPPFEIRRAARAIELAAFRGPYLGQGTTGIRAALESAERDCLDGDEAKSQRRARAVRRLFPEDWQGAHDLLNRLELAVAPLVALFDTRDRLPLATFAQAHATVAENLCTEPIPAPTQDAAIAEPADEPAAIPSPLWQGEAGLAAKTLFEALLQPDLIAPDVAAKDYPDLYRALIATENVRPRIPVHPRLSIWGPFEARLQQCDVLILGSLNDGTWPESADPGPWINRPMRAALKLPAPEEKIGYAAHDFTQLIAGERVYLTRAEKIDGVPTVPSRWLMRLEALLASMGLKAHLRASRHDGATYLAWARLRDQPSHRTPVKRPAPCPPVDIRPRKLSVSAIETWIANPYAIYASRILKLEALPLIGTEPDSAIRGAIIHEALSRFTKAHPNTLPNDIEAQLLGHANAVLQEWTGHPRVAAFWLPRFERFARWFAQTEPARRSDGSRTVAEIKGSTVIGSLDAPFTLTARADRIDIANGTAIITDYKTGNPPSTKQVEQQTSPQLSLEAAIAIAGGFDGVPHEVSGLRYIRASGGEPAGVETLVAKANSGDLAAQTITGLNRHIADFDRQSTPYAVARREGFRYDFDEFAHLARVAEWSAVADEDEEA